VWDPPFLGSSSTFVLGASKRRCSMEMPRNHGRDSTGRSSPSPHRPVAGGHGAHGRNRRSSNAAAIDRPWWSGRTSVALAGEPPPRGARGRNARTRAPSLLPAPPAPSRSCRLRSARAQPPRQVPRGALGAVQDP
jgi:hypothetical protein